MIVRLGTMAWHKNIGYGGNRQAGRDGSFKWPAKSKRFHVNLYRSLKVNPMPLLS